VIGSDRITIALYLFVRARVLQANRISPIKTSTIASRRASVISLSIARNEADKQFDAGVFLRSKAFSQI
jgi:hypothetical protein